MKRKIVSLSLCVFLLWTTLLQTVLAESAKTSDLLLDTATFFDEEDFLPADGNSAIAYITLNGDSAESSGTGVHIQNQSVTISASGIYSVSGTLNSGEIVIDAGEKDVVHLILNGANIHTDAMCAIYVKQAKKVMITLAENTANQLTNNGSSQSPYDTKVDAVIYAKRDLTLNGDGMLTVEADAGHAIACKENLVITGGSYVLTAEKSGISGKDRLSISQGQFQICSGSDGIRTTNNEDTTLGNLCILDGEFSIAAGKDAIQATGTLQIADGEFEICTGGGSKAGGMKASDAAGSWGRSPREFQEANSDDGSAKGIKASGKLMILNGNYFLDCADDGVHAGDDIRIAGGEFRIETADDGIHSDASLHIQNGDFLIPYCYEGLEGQSVTIDGGTFDITSVDDGINAAGGADHSGGLGMPFIADDSAFIEVNSGTITIVSDGDCLDSNGTLTLNGGTLNLTCGGYGNSAIDYESGFQNKGAAVTTNDGSENGMGQMHGMGKNHNFGGMNFEERGTQNGGNPPHIPQDWQWEGTESNRQPNRFPNEAEFPPDGGRYPVFQ